MSAQDQRSTTAPEERGSRPSAARRAGLTLAIIVSTQLMVAIDGNIVNIALPKIQVGLHFSAAGLAWVFSAYSLAFGGLLLLGGRVSDIAGRRRMLVWGNAVVVLASLAGGLAPDSAVLVTARAVQGVGFAFAAPAALSLIAVAFPEGTERTRALAVFSTIAGLGITIGLILGGLLTTVSWRLVFFVNVPIGIAAVLLARPYLPETQRHPSRVDVIGALASTLGMTALVYGMIHAASAGWGSTVTVLALVIGVVLLAAFVFAESRVGQPLLPLRLLADPARASSYLIFLFLLATMGGTYFLLGLYVQEELGFSPLEAGLAFLPMAVAQFCTARSAPKLIRRFGPRPLVIAGVTLMLANSVWLSQISGDGSYPVNLLGPLILLGAGLGLSFVPLNVTILSGLPPRDTGAASGLLQALQQVGLSFGVAVLATIYQSSGPGTSRASATHALAAALVAAIAFSAAALVLALPLAGRRKPAGPPGS
jgi:EmrB/QacA subfamily drug resistance transporter